MTSSEDFQALRIDAARKATPGKSRRGRWIVGTLVVLVLLAIAGFAAFGRGGAEAEVFLVPEQAGAADGVLLSATGYVVAKDAISISPEVSGKVAFIGPDAGEPVEAGQILLQIDSTFYAADYGSAAAQYDELRSGYRPEERRRSLAQRDEAKARLVQLEDDVARQQKLLAEGALSQSQFNAVRSERDAAQARLDAADADLRIMTAGPRQEQVRQAAQRAAGSRASLDRTVIRSPVSGTVIRREISVGEFVIAGQGVGLRDMSTPPPYVVADLGRMEAVVEVAERELQRVHVGMHALIRPDALPDSSFQGIVERITPFAYRQKGTIELRVALLNPSPILKHDMNARIDFLAEGASLASRTALRIPARAVHSDDQGSFVLVASPEGALQRRNVKASPSVSGSDRPATGPASEVLIEDGLEGGELVVLNEGLHAGDQVRLPAGPAGH